MKYAVCLIVCVLPLAACNKSPEVHATNASVGEVASKVAAASAGHELVRPGEWELTTTMEEMSMPGMPVQVQAQMKRVMASKQAHSFQSCITEADVKKPKEDFFAGKNKRAATIISPWAAARSTSRWCATAKAGADHEHGRKLHADEL